MARSTRSTAARYSAIAAVAAIGAAACGAGGYAGSSSSAAKTTPPSTAASVAVRTAAGSTYLTDGHGRTLYQLSIDGNGVSHCGSSCMHEWPAFTSTTTPTAAPGVSAKFTVGAAHQVSYNGHPLYYFAGDHAAGDRNGDGLNDFGGHWSTVVTTGTPGSSHASSPATSGGYGWG